MDKYFIYTDTKPDGEPFYVGKGNVDRLKTVDRNDWHTSIRLKYPDWRREIVFEGTEHECFQEEKRLISLHGRRDLGLGPLVNHTDGGEGTSNVTRSPETREKMSLARKGKKQSEETIAKKSAARIGKKQSEETRAKISAKNAGKKQSAEHIAKRAEAMKGKKR